MVPNLRLKKLFSTIEEKRLLLLEDTSCMGTKIQIDEEIGNSLLKF